MIYLVISPDKLSLNMFCSYMSKEYLRGEKHKIISINSLNSVEKNDKILEDILSNTGEADQVIISCKSLKNKNLEDINCVPSSKYERNASVIFSMDLFSTVPRVLKDRFKSTNRGSEKILEGWDTFIKKVENGL